MSEKTYVYVVTYSVYAIATAVFKEKHRAAEFCAMSIVPKLPESQQKWIRRKLRNYVENASQRNFITSGYGRIRESDWKLEIFYEELRH